MRPSPSFRFGLDQAQKAGKRNESFAKRNETFRSAWHKSLISLSTLNQSFRGIVCFQWLKGVFVSAFFNIRLSTSCLIPNFDGAVLSSNWRDALWARFFTGAPRRQRR